MCEYFSESKFSGGRVKVESDWSNYATKIDLKHATGVYISKFAKNVDLPNIKLDIDKLKNVATNSRNLESKVDKLDVDKLVPVPVDLSKLSDLVKTDVVKKSVCNAEIRNTEDNIPDVTNLATNTTLNTKMDEV